MILVHIFSLQVFIYLLYLFIMGIDSPITTLSQATRYPMPSLSLTIIIARVTKGLNQNITIRIVIGPTLECINSETHLTLKKIQQIGRPYLQQAQLLLKTQLQCVLIVLVNTQLVHAICQHRAKYGCPLTSMCLHGLSLKRETTTQVKDLELSLNDLLGFRTREQTWPLFVFKQYVQVQGFSYTLPRPTQAVKSNKYKYSASMQGAYLA